MDNSPIAGNSVTPSSGHKKASVKPFWILLTLVGFHYGGHLTEATKLHQTVQSAEQLAYGAAALQVLFISGGWVRRGVHVDLPGGMGIVIGPRADSQVQASPSAIPGGIMTPDTGVSGAAPDQPAENSSGSSDDRP